MGFSIGHGDEHKDQAHKNTESYEVPELDHSYVDNYIDQVNDYNDAQNDYKNDNLHVKVRWDLQDGKYEYLKSQYGIYPQVVPSVLMVTMATVVTTAQDMEVMATAVTEKLITEEAMEATKKITTEEVTEAVQDMEDTAVTKNLEAAAMDRKMPQTTRMDNSGQRMKIKNEIEPSTRSFF